MYISPIELIQSDIQMKTEEHIVKAVQRVGVNVDKEELIKALKYDRHQYEKGYAEGMASAQRWIPSYAGENVPEVGDAVLVTFKNRDGEADVFIARWGGNFYDCGYYCLSVSEVLAFMPLPQPWKGEKDE